MSATFGRAELCCLSLRMTAWSRPNCGCRRAPRPAVRPPTGRPVSAPGGRCSARRLTPRGACLAGPREPRWGVRREAMRTPQWPTVGVNSRGAESSRYLGDLVPLAQRGSSSLAFWGPRARSQPASSSGSAKRCEPLESPGSGPPPGTLHTRGMVEPRLSPSPKGQKARSYGQAGYSNAPSRSVARRGGSAPRDAVAPARNAGVTCFGWSCDVTPPHSARHGAIAVVL